MLYEVITKRIHFNSDINKIAEMSDILIFAVPSPFLKQHLSKLKVDISGKEVISRITSYNVCYTKLLR